MNRVEKPEEILKLLRLNFYPRTSYYGIVVQTIVAHTVFEQREVCETFCAACQERCCLNRNHLHVADVLRFYYSGLELYMPTFHPLPKGNRCKMLGKDGCILKRFQRPLVCTSFFCDPISEKHTDLFMLGKNLRQAMEALVKVFLIESKQIDPASLGKQEEILKTLRQTYVEYKNERELRLSSCRHE